MSRAPAAVTCFSSGENSPTMPTWSPACGAMPPIESVARGGAKPMRSITVRDKALQAAKPSVRRSACAAATSAMRAPAPPAPAFPAPASAVRKFPTPPSPAPRSPAPPSPARPSPVPPSPVPPSQVPPRAPAPANGAANARASSNASMPTMPPPSPESISRCKVSSSSTYEIPSAPSSSSSAQNSPFFDAAASGGGRCSARTRGMGWPAVARSSAVTRSVAKLIGFLLGAGRRARQRRRPRG